MGDRKTRYSTSATAKLLRIPRQTVASVYQENVKSGKTANSRTKRGRKSTWDDRGGRRLTGIVQTNRKFSLPQITSQFNEGACTSLCSKTVRRHIAQLSCGSRRPYHVLMLMVQHRIFRLQFAKTHRNCSMDDWKLFIWSEKSRFTLYDVDGRQRVWRKAHNAVESA